MGSSEGVLSVVCLTNPIDINTYFYSSCEYNETKAQLTALLGLHGTARTRISITSITAFAANSNTNTETAYKQFQEDLCQRGVPENLIQEKEDKIREILKSQGMVARRQIVSSDTGAKDQVLETAYETYCKHLYELGFTKELIPPKAWVLKTLKSQGVASSQSSDKDKGQLGCSFSIYRYMSSR